MIWRRTNRPAPSSPTPERSASDAELVHAARLGDKRAFVEIVARHQAMVCGIALGVLGDVPASEDAAQEAFLTAWRKFHDLREPDRLRAWLAQIARNAALGHLRRTRGHDPLDHAPEPADESPTPDEAAAHEEEAALVRQALANLPEAYRLALVLYYREGQSVRAVAEALSLSEDAVKQRLARGREMLRDRMSGLIETALSRTGPTAIFTMTVAAAIGALATPAAVAGTVFSATAVAAGGSTAASVSAPALTLMSTSKSFLVTTAVVAVACIPVGYHLSNGRSPSQANDLPAQIESAVRPPAEKATPRFENSALFAEWRELHDRHGTDAAAMPAIYQEIAGLKDPFRRRAFRAALLAEWAQVDAAGGLKFFVAKGSDTSQRRQFFEEWLAHDAPAAVAALLASGPGWETLARDTLTEIARRVPARVPEIAARLPKAESFWDTKVRDAFAVVAGGNLKSARQAAEALTGPNRDLALAGVAQVWAKADPAAAIAWARALPEGTDRDEVIRAALLGRAAVDPVGALAGVGLVPAGGRHAHFATTTGARVLAEAGKTDFDATIGFLAAHPGKFSRQDLEGLAELVTDRLNADPIGFLSTHASGGSLAGLLPAITSAMLNSASGHRAAIWDWLKTQPDSEPVKELRQEVLQSAAWQDPTLTLRMAADLPRGPDGDRELEALARNLLSGSSRLQHFDQLLEQAPERLRSPLVEAAFKYLRGHAFDDPQPWIDRLSLLPEASRARGIEAIARAWAYHTPEETAAWAATLPPGEGRQGAVGAITSSWAATDTHGVAEWVSAMAPGPERDRGAGSLAAALAEQFPREAWEWALSIADPAERERAATHAAKAMAARDPAAARQWIATGPFSAETKAELASALERPRQSPAAQ